MSENTIASRRAFLKSAAAGLAGIAGVAGLPRLANAANPYYRAIRFVPDRGFNTAQLAILGTAVNMVAARMLNPMMLARARNNYRYYMVNARGRTFRNKAEFEGWFHNIQMQALRVVGFPQLNLYGRYDASGTWTGRGQIGIVTAEFASVGRSRPRYFANGRFGVTLNTALLANRRQSYGSSPDYWAGVICHEMLHNLGHTHPEGIYNGLFIRAYQNAVAGMA